MTALRPVTRADMAQAPLARAMAATVTNYDTGTLDLLRESYPSREVQTYDHRDFPSGLSASSHYQMGVPSLSRKTKVSLPRVTSRAKIVSTPSNWTLVPTTVTSSPFRKTRSYAFTNFVLAR